MAKRFFITSDILGNGEDELGELLMRNFFYSLARNEEKPEMIVLVNTGVRLACVGSEVIDDLELLVEEGVMVKSCGTCLDYLGLTNSLLVGEIGTMPQMAEVLTAPAEIVTIT